MSELPRYLTIGHSNHSLERFVELVHGAGIDLIVDVRSSPYSRYNPHFNREALAKSLSDAGVDYAFFGAELGGRPSDPDHFTCSTADYEKMAEAGSFRRAMGQTVEFTRDRRIALMCAERDPIDCHRCLLVARAAHEFGAEVGHVLASGEVKPHEWIEERLLGGGGGDLFTDRQMKLVEAYRAQGRKVAFSTPGKKPEAPKGMFP